MNATYFYFLGPFVAGAGVGGLALYRHWFRDYDSEESYYAERRAEVRAQLTTLLKADGSGELR